MCRSIKSPVLNAKGRKVGQKMMGRQSRANVIASINCSCFSQSIEADHLPEHSTSTVLILYSLVILPAKLTFLGFCSWSAGSINCNTTLAFP